MKFLITNLWINQYSGSEITCFELARWLIDRGHTVSVYCFELGDPMHEKLRGLGTEVTNDSAIFVGRRFDVIWAHHAVVLNQIMLLDVVAPKIVLSCLSPFESFEYPPVYANRLSLVLANSEETKEKLLSLGVRAENINVFPNFIDKACFKAMPRERNLSRVLCVSNHPANEVREASSLLCAKGIVVDFMGLNGNRIELVTADVLSEYDVVITIGKTVQYAMAVGIPVYCYDIHGGSGYLSPNNVEHAFTRNFSGRGFEKKLAESIAAEIVDGFAAAYEHRDYLGAFVRARCDLTTNIEKVLANLEDAQQIGREELMVDQALFRRVFDLWRRAENALLAPIGDSTMELFWNSGDGFDQARSMQTISERGRRTYRFDLSSLSGLCELRIDPACRPCRVFLHSAKIIDSDYRSMELKPTWANNQTYDEALGYGFYHNDPFVVFSLSTDLARYKGIEVDLTIDWLKPEDCWSMVNEQFARELAHREADRNRLEEITILQKERDTLRASMGEFEQVRGELVRDLAKVAEHVIGLVDSWNRERRELQDKQDRILCDRDRIAAEAASYEGAWREERERLIECIALNESRTTLAEALAQERGNALEAWTHQFEVVKKEHAIALASFEAKCLTMKDDLQSLRDEHQGIVERMHREHEEFRDKAEIRSKALEIRVIAMEASTSWKITAGLRAVGAVLKRHSH